MSRSLRLAARGLFTTSPNPRVGCVIVGRGEVLAEAWHERAGEPHAEVLALRQAGDRARGGTVYLNLEPCCHQGRTPPCTGFLIDAGVARVVVAMEDPNPRVSAGGVTELRRAGIDVDVGLMERQAAELNRGFIQRMRSGRPWVVLKVAASMDGRTAMASGESRWITNEAARRDVQVLRARSSAILTGIGTVAADDPALTVRLPGVVMSPMKVVADSRLSIGERARVFDGGGPVLICTTVSDERRAERLARCGAEVVVLPDCKGEVDLPALMSELSARGVNELLIEAGRTLNGAMLQADLVDELIVYLAPYLLGDAAQGMFRLPGLERLQDRFEFKIRDLRQFGDNLRVTLTRTDDDSTNHLGR